MSHAPVDSPAAEYGRRTESRSARARRNIVRFGVWSLVGEFATWALIVAFGQDDDWALTRAAAVIWLVAWHLTWIPVGTATFVTLRDAARLPPAWIAAGLMPWIAHCGWIAFILVMYFN